MVVRRPARLVFGRRRRESVKLSVARDGSLKVAAPLKASLKLIQEFVLANADWIEAQQVKAMQRAANSPAKRFVPGETFRLFGVERELVFETIEMKSRPRIELVENYLVAYVPRERALDETLASETVRSIIAKFYDRQARLHLPERVEFFSRAMQVKPSGLSFRCQKTRWGSCSSLGHISLNWKIVFAPETVIDYLVVHELAHLVHANHSSEFWALVKKHDPEYLAHRRWLRDHQSETEFLDQSLDRTTE